MRWNPFNTKVGLALGGGAARGIAHIGVLRAFEEEGVDISYLSGTSIGALIASYKAFGKSSKDIEEIVPKLNYRKILSFNVPKKGFVKTDAIRKMIESDIGDVNIEDAEIPLAICTTDISSGEQVIIRKGNLADAVCASVAVPGLFVPVEIEDRELVDGGLTENVPLSPLEDMGAGVLVGVDLNGVAKYPNPKDIATILANAMDIAIDSKTRDQMKKADIAVSLDLSGYTRMDNSDKSDELIKEGYSPMKEKLKDLLWYKKTNLIQYGKKLILEFIPLKIPEFIKEFVKEKRPTKKIE